MAFDQTTRNRLARFVSDARALLTEEFTRQLQNEYGLDPASGEVTPIERLTALDDRRRETAQILRDTLDYYLAGNPKADAKTFQGVLDRIVREQAFTVLNRLCALRMSEARGLVLETIAKGYQSKGFQLFARLAGSALGETGEAYRSYLLSLMDEFAVDLPVLFDRYNPQGRLFPREAALLKLLGLINDPEIDPLWTEDETIGWIYQYFNSKDERKAMRDASQAPRNSRELAVRNQFFTPRYVVEFLTDNTMGRIWYEMTRGETALINSCQYLVRRKHAFFLAEGQTAPDPFLPEQQHETDPDLAHEMWLPPNDQISDLETIFLYAMTAGGYDYANEKWGIECGDLANEKLKQYHETRKWEGSFDELRCCLFFEQRRYHHFGQGPDGDDAKVILELYQTICERWNLEVEFIPHRPLKDPRELKMLDPACGSMHFGLYAFDLFEQIYAEAWDLEESLEEDALQRLADLDPLHKTYPDKGAYLRDVPRLIIERNIHGVDIDPRAVQIAGLSLWLRAQKSWQAQGLRTAERPQIRKSNVVCAEPMPGDRQMLEEFLGTLRGNGLEALMRKAWRVPEGKKVHATPQMSDALAKLVRTIWQEMELAGEAGSLLKIEETMRGAITAARKESEEKSPLFRVLEYGLREPSKEQYVQLLAGEEQDFFDRAEGLVLAALFEYSEQAENGDSFRRRLFAGDAVQGFKFIDLFYKKFDTVVMNPPFGLAPKSVNSNLAQYYKDTYVDLYACFVSRGLNLCPNGIVGAITSRAFEMTKKLARWRENQLINSIDLIIDLGLGVMDDAFVEAASYILQMNNPKPHILVFDRRFNQIKNNHLSVFSSSEFYLVNRKDIRAIPGQKLLYSLPHTYFKLLKDSITFEPLIGTAREGLRTFDDFRFVRLRWEVPYHEIGEEKTWEPYAKGGEFSRYYSDIHLLVKWNRDGRELAEVNRLVNGQIAQSRQASEYYHRCGVTYSKRSAKGFSGRALPAGCIIGTKGPAILSESSVKPAYLVGWINSNIIVNLIHIQANAFEFNTGIIKNLPWRNLENQDQLTKLTENTIVAYQKYKSIEETNSLFVAPIIKPSLEEISQLREKLLNSARTIEKDCQIHWDLSLQKAYSVPSLLQELSSDDNESPDEDDEQDLRDDENCLSDSALSIISYSLGVAFGRWNVQCVEKMNDLLEPPNPFAQLPICSPGMLQNIKGLPATRNETSVEYPIRIFDDGILVNDEGNNRDIIHLSRTIFYIIFGNNSEAIEQSINQILSLHSYREYFQKPLGFFTYHLGQYSKSRRQAPIYWPLSTPSCSYTLWLYYQRLNDQTLYTCVNDFVDPKLKQVYEEVARLRLKKGRSAADEKELERLTDFERELKDFREEFLRVAKYWKPNLNDGVEITAAPLWKLFQHKPWQKRLKETWQKLEDGEYDWAHLAYSIWPDRVREKCKSDKSLAIAHDLEELYVEPASTSKKKTVRVKKGRVDMDDLFDGDE